MTNDKYQKQIAKPAIIMPKNFEKERKVAEHAGRIRQALWGILRVPSFSACSAFPLSNYNQIKDRVFVTSHHWRV